MGTKPECAKVCPSLLQKGPDKAGKKDSQSCDKTQQESGKHKVSLFKLVR